jgi:hypothetical protein
LSHPQLCPRLEHPAVPVIEVIQCLNRRINQVIMFCARKTYQLQPVIIQPAVFSRQKHPAIFELCCLCIYADNFVSAHTLSETGTKLAAVAPEARINADIQNLQPRCTEI